MSETTVDDVIAKSHRAKLDQLKEAVFSIAGRSGGCLMTEGAVLDLVRAEFTKRRLALDHVREVKELKAKLRELRKELKR